LGRPWLWLLTTGALALPAPTRLVALALLLELALQIENVIDPLYRHPLESFIVHRTGWQFKTSFENFGICRVIRRILIKFKFPVALSSVMIGTAMVRLMREQTLSLLKGQFFFDIGRTVAALNTVNLGSLDVGSGTKSKFNINDA
jgi:hypothetical protein